MLTITAFPVNYVLLLPRRVWNLLRTTLSIFWPTQRNKFNKQNKPLPFWIRPFYFIGILICKIVDLSGITELLDVIFMLTKYKTRSLTKLEIDEAIKVYGTNFPYWQIRIDEHSLVAKIGAKMGGHPNLGMGLVLFRSINFNKQIYCKEGNGDMSWLIHELMHVQQMQKIGSSYIIESLAAQHYWGYDFGSTKNVVNFTLKHFNIEQQAEIMKSFYQQSVYGEEPKETYQEALKEMKLGLL